MIKINFYRYLSDAFDLIEVEPGKKILESIPEVKEWKKYKILVNCKFVDENYILKEDDKVIIKSIPYESYSPSDWIKTIATGGIYFFVKAGKEAYEATKAAKKAEEELNKLKNQTKDDVTNIPYLKGSSNTVATGKTQPYLVGTNLLTPYILNASKSGSASKGYHTIDGALGETQYLNRVYEMGFGPQVIQKIFMGNLLLADFGKTSPFEESEFHFQNKAFAGDNSFCEIRHGNRFTHSEFNTKIVESEKSDNLKYKDDEDYQDLIYTLEPNTMSADICIMFNGLMKYTSSGAKGSKTRNIIPSYSLNYAELAKENRESEATWIPFNFTKAEWHEPVTTTTNASYRWNLTPKQGKYGPYVEEPSRAEILANINNWTLTSGTDIRSNYNNINTVFYSGYSPSAFGYVEIYLNKKTTTPGYYTDPIQTTSFSGQYSKQIRFNAHVDFSFSDLFESYTENNTTKYKNKYSQPISIKLSTTDNKTTDGTDVADVYVQWLHSYTYDTTKTISTGSFVAEKIIEDDALYMMKGTTKIPISTLIGMKMEANIQNQDLQDSIQVVSSGVARVFEKDSNGNYSLSADKKMTSNPAAWWWEIQTSDCHIASKYADDEMDIDTFGKWYDFCNTKGFNCNFVIIQGQTKTSILDQILNCGRASTYSNRYHEISVAWDDVKENASGLLNEQNLVSFSYEKEFSRKVDGIVCEYIDAENNYQTNTITVMYDGTLNPESRNPETTLKKITANGMTSWKEAYKYCLYVMKCDRYRKKKCTAIIGEEGFFFTPLSKFLIQHPSLKIGLGNAEIKNVILNENDYITGLELYDAVTLSNDRDFNIVVQCVSDTYCTLKSYAIKNYDGRTKTIEFKNPFSVYGTVIPHAGDVLSYGYEVSTVTREMLITEIDEVDNGYSLKLVDYDARIVNDDFYFPEYKPVLTDPQNNAPSIPSSLPSPTIAEVSTIVQNAVDEIDMSFVESPNVYAELNGCGFAVNDDGITPIKQQITTKVHVIQEDKEIDFVFGDFNLPDGFSVDINYHSVTFTAAKGTRISTGEIKIPVYFRPILHDNFYADEDGTIYEDEDGNAYGIFDYAQKLTIYDLGFNYSGIKGGSYLGAYDNVEEITQTIIIGDYFTYSGEDSDTFKKGGTYAWDGLKWVEDSVSSHMGGALSDVLNVANNNLQLNNSKAYQLLDHLTSNSVFVDKLVANTAYINKLTANEAFISNLLASNVTVKNKGIIKSENYNGTIDSNGNITFYGNTGWAIDHNGKSDFVNINSTGGNFDKANLKSASMEYANIDGMVYLGTVTFSRKSNGELVYYYTSNIVGVREYGGAYIVSFRNTPGGIIFDYTDAFGYHERSGVFPTIFNSPMYKLNSVSPTGEVIDMGYCYAYDATKIDVNVSPLYAVTTRSISDSGSMVGVIVSFDDSRLMNNDSASLMLYGAGMGFSGIPT